MSLVSSRQAIGRALVATVGAITDPATSSLPLLQKVKLGALFDPSGFDTWGEIIHFSGQGTPAGSGGDQIGWRIDEEVTFLLTVGIGPYEIDSEATQDTMLGIQDVLLPSLHTHFQLPSATNMTQAIQSVYSVLPLQVDRSRPARFPNGHVYLLWDVPVVVKQGYTVTLTQP